MKAAQIRTPNLYHYLTAANQAGTKTVIRITPSPGNYRDYASPDKDNHILITDTVPAGAADGQDYCDENDNHNRDRFHDILDIAQELVAITQLNRQQGWQSANVYFEPANEPNNEWYTYNSTRFDGYNWHNYWNYGYETLDDFLDIVYCTGDQEYQPSSHHLIQYFPQWLRQQFANEQKPTFITEADLNSHCQDSRNVVTNKVTQWEQTKESLDRFIGNTFLTRYVVVWLLVQEDDGLIGYCADGNYEIYWHEAYWEIEGDSGWNRWFTEW